LHQKGLLLNREVEDRFGTGWALHLLSLTLLSLAERGDVDAAVAVPVIQEGLTIWRELGERRHFAFALCDLATAAILEHDLARAHALLMQSQSIFGQLGGWHGVRWALGAQMFLLAAAGDLESTLCLHGAVFPSAHHIPVPYRQRMEKKQQLAEEMLDADTIARALTDGREMSPTQAVAYAERACAAVSG